MLQEILNLKGKYVSRHMDKKAVRLLSALLFIRIGLFTLMRAVS